MTRLCIAITLGLAFVSQARAGESERTLTPASKGANRAAVDVALLAAAAPHHDLDDLRLTDAAGKEVPYLLVTRPPPAIPWRAGHILPIPATYASSGFEVDLGEVLLIDRLKLDGLGTPLLKRFHLEGSADRQHWIVLIDEGTVFDLPEESLTHTELEFPRGRLRYLRVSFDDTSSTRVGLPRIAAAHPIKPSEPAPQLVAVLPFVRQKSSAGASRFRLQLPASSPPIVALELSVGAGHLLRTARVIEPRWSGTEVEPVEIGASTLRRAERSGIAAADLRIPCTRPEGRELELIVDDASNPPLDLLEVRARYAPQPFVYFESTDGKPLSARVGDPKRDAPHYDLEAVRDSIDSAKLGEASWGPIRDSASSLPAPLPAPAVFTGAAIDRVGFRYARAIVGSSAGLCAIPLDLAVLAHTRDFSDVRIVDDRGRQVPFLIERLDAPITVPLALDKDASTSGQRSAYAVRLPFATLPAARMQVSTSARVFSRELALSVAAPDPAARAPQRRVVDTRTWSHADLENAAPPLEIALPESVPEVRLELDEGDNSPLPLTGAMLVVPAYRLRFFHEAGRGLTLVYGRALEAPRYDLALLRGQLVGATAEELSLAPETQAIAIDTSAPPQARLFWAALVLMVLVLLGFIARLVKRAEPPPQ